MSWTRFARGFATIATITGIARSVDGQQRLVLQAGFHSTSAGDNPVHTGRMPLASDFWNAPSRTELTLLSTGGSLMGALLGGGVGFIVDEMQCKRELRYEGFFRSRPCVSRLARATGTGWFGGAVVGGAATASSFAFAGGCPRRKAVVRAIGGALVGAAPGLGATLHQPGRYPPGKAALISATPILVGVGATTFVARCRELAH